MTPDTYIWQRETVSNIGGGAAPLITGLQDHFNEMRTTGDPGTDNGMLQPALFRPGLVGGFLLYGSPAETVYILSDIYPLVDSTTQTNIRSYLTTFMSTYPPLSRTFIHGTTDWGSVVMARNRREFYPMAANFSVNIWPPVTVPIEVVYVMWRYADATGDWAYLNTNMSTIQSLYNGYTAPATRYGQIMGLVGMARIADHFGNTSLRDDAVSKATAAIGASNWDTWLRPPRPTSTAARTTGACPVFHFARLDRAWSRSSAPRSAG